MFNFIVGVDSSGHPVHTPIPPASEEAVQKFESEIGERLPEEYRSFLKKVNGGSIDVDEHNGIYACFPVQWEESKHWGKGINQAVVGYIYSLDSEFIKTTLNKKSTYQIYEALEDHKSEGEYFRIPGDTIPIGDDAGSNLILLGIQGKNKGKVFYWFREGEKNTDDPNPPNYDNVGFIANTFNEFLSSIHECRF